MTRLSTVSTVVNVATCEFKELHPTEGYKKMAALTLPTYHVKDWKAMSLKLKLKTWEQILNTTFQKTNSVNLVSLVKCA